MTDNLKVHIFTAWIFGLRHRFLPDDSLMGGFYCRYLQPIIRRSLDMRVTFFQGKDHAYGAWQGVRTIRSRHAPNEIKQILVVKPDHIGDFVLGFPAYRLLKESFPDAEVTLLCGAWNAELAKDSGLFDHVATMDLMPEISGACTGKIHFDQAAFDALSLPAFDIAIDFRDSSETRFLLDMVRTKFRAGFYASAVVSHMDLAFPSAGFRLSPGKQTHHQALQTLLVSAVVAAHKDDSRMHATLKAAASPTPPVALMRAGKGPIVGINPGSGMREKNWPLEWFIMLGLRLIKERDATLVLFGSRAQENEGEALARSLPVRNVLNLTGKLSLMQSISTLQGLDTYIGNDTGTTHMAASLDIPTVCLFSGVTTHDSHGPRGANCVSILADKKKGMASISVSHVMQALSGIDDKLFVATGLGGEINLIVIDTKIYNADFRKYLIRAAGLAGANAVHLACREAITVTLQESVIEKYPSYTPAEVIAEDMLRLLGQKNTIILVGLGLCAEYAALINELKMLFTETKILYDAFDYFPYGAKGRLFLKRQKLDGFWQEESDCSLILEQGLSKIYPKALHFDNASHLERLPAVAMAQPNRLVYIGSIDSRVDFEWLEALAGHAVALDIYGQVHESEPEIGRRLKRYLRSHKNVVFHGSYDNDNLPAILSRYRIGIIPYKANDVMTDHVNPDKVYHYLNAGLEVIATPIPQLCRMAPYLHLTHHAGEIAAALGMAQTAPRNPSWPVNDYSWETRWEELRRHFCAEPAAEQVTLTYAG